MLLSMRLNCLLWLLTLHSWSLVMADSGCEVCDLKEELATVRLELEDCEGKLTDQSYLGQVCSRVGNWVGGDKDRGLRSTVERLLTQWDLLSSTLDPKTEFVERDVLLRLSNEDLRNLRKFVLNDDGRAEDVSRILTSSLQQQEAGLLDHTSDLLLQTSLHIRANYVVLCQAGLLICCLVLPLLLDTPWWKVFLFLAFYCILNTWVHEYYKACARKQATLAKLGSVPKSCLVEHQGWLAAGRDFVRGLFNGVEDPCEAYYTAAMVDPAFEVGLLHAVMETFSVCLVIPARTVGQSLGSYYNSILAPVPLMWKVPVLILATLLLVLLLLVCCRYEFKIPFLLTIQPGRRREGAESECVKQEGRLGVDSSGKEERRGNSPWLDLHPSTELDTTDRGNVGWAACPPLPYPTRDSDLHNRSPKGVRLRYPLNSY